MSQFLEEATNAMVRDYADVHDVQMIKNEHTDNCLIPIRTWRQCTILPLKDSIVPLAPFAAGLFTLNPHPTVAKNRGALTSRGVMEVVPKKRFYLLVEITSAGPVHIPKQVYGTIASPPFDNIMYVHF